MSILEVLKGYGCNFRIYNDIDVILNFFKDMNVNLPI